MFTRRMLVALAACAVLTSSTAFAGGNNGGTKQDPIIKVRNDSGAPIAAFIDPDPAKIASLPAQPTKAQIEAAGGKLVNPGATAEFKMQVGTYLLAAGSNVSTAATANVTTVKGQVYSYAYTNANALVRIQ